ncbi:unnamed protein product [Closterium sp. NIES-64]|nr:unnamed protein product [Closterium sp. NIES-64]
MGAGEAQWGEGAQAVRGTAQSVQGGGEGAGKAPSWLGRHTGAQPVKQDGLAEVHEEWVLHAKLLHSSFPWWGRSIHAKHHRRPYHHVSVDKPDVVLPVVAGAAIVSRLILGASTLSLTALMAYYLMAITYEWTHFL